VLINKYVLYNRGGIIRLSKKILLISLLCIFFITVSASFAATSKDIAGDPTTTLDKSINDNKNIITLSENIKTSSEVKTTEVKKSSDVKTTEIKTSEVKKSSQVKTATKDKWKAAGAVAKPKKLTQSQILTASKNIDKYVTKNKKFPNTVTIAGYKFSMQEYTYLLSKVIVNKQSKKSSAIAVKYDIKNPSLPSGVNIKGKLTKNQYVDLAKRTIKYIDKNKQVPNFVNSKLGAMQYQTALHTLNKVVSYSKANKGKLPNSLSLNVPKNHNMNKVLPKYTRGNEKPTPAPTPISKTLTVAEIKDGAVRLNNYVIKNKVLPKNIDLGGKKYSMSDFLYILSKTIVNLDKRSLANVAPIDTSSPTKATGNSISGNLTKEEYVDLATRVLDFIVTNKQAPNYGTTPLGKMQYQTMISEFSKIIASIDASNQLPDEVTIDVKSTDSINGETSGDVSSPSLNDKYDGEDLGKYLKATKNCQVTASVIKTLAATITKGCKTESEKANAIFKWMNKNVKYSFYYNTKKGATGTLSAKSGNCVDQAHLSIALYRASGLAARYVSGNCKFTSGSTYGHVWAQVKIGNTWTVSDTTSTKNSLGVIKNWNTQSYKLLHGKIAEIFF